MTPRSLRYRLDRIRHGLLRRRLARRTAATYDGLLAEWDHESFRRQLRPFWDPFETLKPAKFLDLDTWLRETAFRYHLIDVDRPGRPLRVLDLGAGTGYFLAVCRHHGHEVQGLDLGDEPLYDACFQWLDIPRFEHRIEPEQPLPASNLRWDLVVAFMTCFNQDTDGTPWGPQPWTYFLDDIHSRLSPAGRLVLKFNLDANGRFYDAPVRRTLATHSGFRARFFFDYAFLTKA